MGKYRIIMWKNNCVAISLLVVALTAVNLAESRRSFGGRRISPGGVYKRPSSNQHANPVHLSYGSDHGTAPKPAHTGGSHAYPSSGGLSGSNSGGGGHAYPSSGGLSGTNTGGGSNSYPSPGGLSGSNTGGGSHGYPSSNGLSGSNAGNNGASSIQNTHVNPVNSAYPSNNHGYPSSNGGVSGSHGYPAGNGLSGHGSNNQPPPYSPSQYPNNHYQPNYHANGVNGAPYGGHPMPYPPYQGPPPMYVQQVQSSGSRFGDILTGLAIYNLAQSAANKFSSPKHSATENSNGKPKVATTDDMACILRIIGDNKTESVKVPCDIVSSFITVNSTAANTTISTTSNATTVTNATATADNKTNSVLTNSTEAVNGTTTDASTTSTASVDSASSGTNMSTTTESATAHNVSGPNESPTVVTNTSNAVPNDTNKTDNTTPQPTITTGNESSETTTPTNLPETTPGETDKTTIAVSQTVTPAQNVSSSNATDVSTMTPTPSPTNASTVLPMNETTVSPTATTTNTIAMNSSSIQNAVDPIAVKGPNIEVKPDYECVIEMYKNKSMKSNKVPCALLLQYTVQGASTTARPQPRAAASPSGSPSAFANSEKLAALCLVLFWVRYNV